MMPANLRQISRNNTASYNQKFWRTAFSGLFLIVTIPVVAPPAQSQAPKPTVDVATPLVQNVREWDQYTGRFQAVSQIELRARVSGYLKSVHFKDGQLVNKGDLLFVIDPSPLEAALSAVKAGQVSAQAQLRLANTDLKRGEELLRRKVTAVAEVDRRRSQRDVAAANVLVARANVRTAELNLAFTNIRAPIDGRMSDRRVDIGNLIGGGSEGATLLTTIVSQDPIHFEFNVSEQAYLKYARLNAAGKRPGSRETPNPVYIRLTDEKGWPRRGVMNFVDNVLGRETGTVRGRAVLENSDRFLQPGMFGEIRLLASGEYEAVLLPDAAILFDQATKIVMVVGQDNKVGVRIIETGPIIDGLRVVRNGLTASDRVIVKGLQRVRAGMEVVPTVTPIKSKPDGLDPTAGQK
jgi:membrane fusion protein, multidrug efflux system